ncbi:MAG: diguanylate cyclase [Gammaproteobacteria bacterium]|nr:diguanylate cyclase [Gammaproteobacteria bacterium]
MLRQALDAVSVPALVVDAQCEAKLVVYANPAAGRALSLQASELVGRSANSLCLEPVTPESWQLRARDGAVLALRPVPLYAQPGQASFWLLTAAAPAQPAAQAPARPAAVSARIEELPSRIVRDDRTDVTTGIPGRNAFLEVQLRDWVAARQEQKRLSVIVFRIDALESYQKLFGRHATETCLRRVAHAISNSLQRSTDYCARVGNDRFAVLISGGAEDRVAQFAERIAQRVWDLAIHHPRSQPARYVTVSFAMASEIPPASAEEPGLLEDAEARISRGHEPVELRSSSLEAG